MNEGTRSQSSTVLAVAWNHLKDNFNEEEAIARLEMIGDLRERWREMAIEDSLEV